MSNKTAKTATTANTANTFKKADAFINKRMKSKDGKSYQVGSSGIALHKESKADGVLIERYTNNPELISELDVGPFIHSFTLVDNSPETELDEDAFF